MADCEHCEHKDDCSLYESHNYCEQNIEELTAATEMCWKSIKEIINMSIADLLVNRDLGKTLVGATGSAYKLGFYMGRTWKDIPDSFKDAFKGD